MADGIEPEFIPNPDLLFCRVHHTQFNVKEGRITRVVFEKVNQSVDWSRYSSREETVGRHRKPQDIRGVASIDAGACRDLDQEVVHVPLGPGESGGPNRAHAEIRGAKSKETQSRLRDAVNQFWQNPRFVG
jgi:hypothetical protein